MEKRTVFYEKVKERMLRYAAVDTQSDARSAKTPTTEKQLDLARMLEEELREIGAKNVRLDEEKCVVYSKLPPTADDKGGMALGLIAHMDTAPDSPGRGVKPWVLEGYGGGDIVLNREKGIVMSPSEFPALEMYTGHDLILADGTTLLGADDKAGIAEIMTAAEYLIAHPELPRPAVSIAFTPDEEVGGLARDLDIERFGARFAYTVDGDHLGFYNDETFNASRAQLTVFGRSVHTGTAKGIMVNAADIASEFLSMLPPKEKPQYTEGYEGFFHVISVNGSCEHAQAELLIRDHDRRKFEAREAFLVSLAEKLKRKYGSGALKLEISETYRNMKEITEKYPFLTENLKKAIREAGIEPKTGPFRGGTDGSALSQRGLPCPNLSAGYENAHGRFEFVSVNNMEKTVEILIRLIRIYAGVK